MSYTLLFTFQSDANLTALEAAPHLGYLEQNPRHPSLHTHKFTAIKGQSNEEVFEAYAENKTPAAYRIFWHYGPGKDKITIIAITPHP